MEKSAAESNYSERRTEARVPLIESFSYTIDDGLGIKYFGIIIDVSRSGMSFYTFQPLQPGHDLHIYISNPIRVLSPEHDWDMGKISKINEMLKSESLKATIVYSKKLSEDFYRIGITRARV